MAKSKSKIKKISKGKSLTTPKVTTTAKAGADLVKNVK
jgi:hypothetical protein